MLASSRHSLVLLRRIWNSASSESESILDLFLAAAMVFEWCRVVQKLMQKKLELVSNHFHHRHQIIGSRPEELRKIIGSRGEKVEGK